MYLRSALQGYNTGAELADALLYELIVRKNFVCGVHNLNEPDFGLHDPELLDDLYDVLRGDACVKAGMHEQELQGYSRTVHVPPTEIEEFGASR